MKLSDLPPLTMPLADLQDRFPALPPTFRAATLAIPFEDISKPATKAEMARIVEHIDEAIALLSRNDRLGSSARRKIWAHSKGIPACRT